MANTTTSQAASAAPERQYKRRSMLQETWRRFRKKKGAVVEIGRASCRERV